MKMIQQMFIINTYSCGTQYTLTWDMLYAAASRDHIGSYIVKDVCKNKRENINNCEGITEKAHYCMLLLQEYGLYLLTF
jgi:hypothetical protein